MRSVRPPNSGSRFTRFAKAISRAAGRPAAFCGAVAVIAGWAVCGPMFGFSDTWQLVINTGTTIVTFLMVFLIQNTQNRDSEAIHVKLDELIRSMKGAHLALLDLEELDEKVLNRIIGEYRELAEQARRDLKAGKSDTDVREVSEQYISKRKTAKAHLRRKDAKPPHRPAD